MKVKAVHAAVVAALSSAAGLTMETALAQGVLEEIRVTATRREANLQEVPISIVAITGDNLQVRGLDSLERVSQAIPNVVATGGGGGTAGTGFSVRGIPNVSTYVDGIWQIDTAGALVREFVDLDRIEVLRGPQGTRFGRDSTGGAIRLWTKRPVEEFGGDVTAIVGTHDRRDVRLAVDLPLGERLFTKWTGASLYRDGYIHNLTTGNKDGGIDQTVFRGDLLWEPIDVLTVRLIHNSIDNTFTEPKVIDAIFRTFGDPGINDVIGLPEFYGTVPGLEPFNPQNNQAGFPGGRVGKWENRSNVWLPNEMSLDQTTLDISWAFTERLSLQSLTGYTKQFNKLSNDWDVSQYDIVYDINQQRNELFSQEFQLLGEAGRVSWVGGVYYWEQKSHRRETRNVVSEFLGEFPAGGPLGIYDLQHVFDSPQCTAPVPEGFRSCERVIYDSATGDPALGPLQLTRNGYDRIPREERDGYALFGEVSIALTDTLDLALGVRYHEETRGAEQLVPIPGLTAPRPLTSNRWHVGGDPFAGTTATAGPGVPWEHTYDKLTTRLTVQKQFNDRLMGYLGYSEGFDSGGVATPTIEGVRHLIPFEPQTIKTVELGMRSDWADGRLRVNVTLFDTAWEDFQSAGVVYGPDGRQVPQLQTTNVGDAAARGMELEFTVVPIDSLFVNLNLGLLDTEYTDLPEGQRSGHLPWTKSTAFPRAPKKSYSIGFQHNANLGNGGSITSRLDYLYQGQFWRFEPFLRMDAYPSIPPGFNESGDHGVLNARLTYEPAGADWSFSVFGTNLTNKYMINSGFFHGIWGFDFATVGRPREAGASFRFRF